MKITYDVGQVLLPWPSSTSHAQGEQIGSNKRRYEHSGEFRLWTSILQLQACFLQPDQDQRPYLPLSSISKVMHNPKGATLPDRARAAMLPASSRTHCQYLVHISLPYLTNDFDMKICRFDLLFPRHWYIRKTVTSVDQ